MTWALAAVLLSAACAGTANVLQAREARQFRAAERLNPGLMVGLVRRGGYQAALVLLGAGMALALYALRLLPVFLVQAGRAASLGVTAVLSVLVLGTRPRRSELVAVGVVAVGLVALALSTGPQLAAQVPDGPRLALVGAVLGVAVLAAWASRAGMDARVRAGARRARGAVLRDSRRGGPTLAGAGSHDGPRRPGSVCDGPGRVARAAAVGHRHAASLGGDRHRGHGRHRDGGGGPARPAPVRRPPRG